MPRSGNHAIIEWLMRNLDTQSLIFLNNCGEGDPFQSFSYCNFFIEGTRRKHRGNIHREKNAHFDRLMNLKGNVEQLVISYEMFSPLPNERKCLWEQCGINGTLQRDIFVVRSPLNLIASSLQRIRKEYARPRRCSARTNLFKKQISTQYGAYMEVFGGAKTTTVIYDRWGAEEDYRLECLKELSLSAVSLDLGEMTDAGGGSSFDANQEVRTISMSRRWENFREDSDFLESLDLIAKSEKAMTGIEEVFPDDYEVIRELIQKF